jgi:hypothetical protein
VSAKHIADTKAIELPHRRLQNLGSPQVGDRHLGPGLCKKARARDTAAVEPEPHHRDTLAPKFVCNIEKVHPL